jgi:hypothetical protein
MNEPEDDIVKEIRLRRQAHAESLDYDMRRITEDLQRQERESGAKIVQRPPRKAEDLPKRSSA